MTPENDLQPHTASPLPPAERLLVFAPHPDDEVFGCGGAVAMHASRGGQVRTIVLSSGEQGGDASIREVESQAAASILGTPPPEFWRLPDRGLAYEEALIQRIADLLREYAPQIVFAPSLWEVHPDHRTLAMVVLESARRSGIAAELFMYEVGAPLRPNFIVDISAVAAQKQEAMQAFVSQNRLQDYPAQIAGLNRYRAYSLRSRIASAEAFERVPMAEIGERTLSFYQSEYARQQAKRLERPFTVAEPLVSVIIRSMDRPQLNEALQSVGLQTWGNIEVIVVNARGDAHSELPSGVGVARVRVESGGTPLRRAAAANFGLQQARGDYCCFLDDDDWLAPGHIAGLVRELQQHPACLAAYSSTVVVLSDGKVVDLYDDPFDRAELQARNYLPIHSVLFRTAVRDTCRFDESFDVFEDWDFWLQLVARGGFRHVAQETAYYRADLGTSTISANKDDTAERAGRQRLYAKWGEWWTPHHLEQALARLSARIAELRARDRALSPLPAELAVTRERLAAALQDLERAEELKTYIARCEARIHSADADAALRDDFIEEQRAHIAGLEAALGRAQQQIEDGHQLARDLTAARAQENAEYREAKARLDWEIAALREELLRVYASRSWKITAPLRSVRALGTAREAGSEANVLAKDVSGPAVETPVPIPVPRWLSPTIPKTVGEFSALVAAPVSLPTVGPAAIVLPVYNGHDFLPPLLASLRRSLSSRDDCHICIVDDASTDVRVRPLLEEFVASQPNAVLLANERNRGFVHSANKGMSAALDRLPQGTVCPVVILNSDTELPDGWLERIAAPMLFQPESVASVTPFTNAGTICSFPRFIVDNEMPAGASLQTLDDACRPLAGLALEIPTGVGFCMAMNSEVMRRIGLFDEEAFGRGYAEENDWCQRAVADGYVNLLQPGLFVWHKHGGTFTADEKKALVARNLQCLGERYPNYHGDVARHVEADPAAPLRAWVGLSWALRNGGAALSFDHDMGGGANDYRRQWVAARLPNHAGVLVYLEDFVRTSPVLNIYSLGTEFRLPVGARGELTGLGADGAIDEVFYNDAPSFAEPLSLPGEMAAIATRHQAKFVVAMHDFYPLCPSYTLLDDRQVHCGVPTDRDICRRCLPRNAFMLGSTRPCADIDAWRGAWLPALRQASEILCFSDSSAALVRRAYSGDDIAQRIVVRPHTVHSLPRRVPTVNQFGPLVLGAVGAIGLQKGSRILRRMGKLIEAKRLPIRIVIIGQADIQDFPGCVTVTGRYKPEELPDLIERHGVNMAVMTSIWPETFSYVTSELMAMHLRILAFDLGAPAERLRDYPLGRLVEAVNADAMLDAAVEWHREIA